VVAADVSEQGLQETVRLVEQAGGRALAVKCDVSLEEEVNAALDKTDEAFGRLDFAFNNAGVEHQPTPQPISPHRSGIGSSTSICAASFSA